MFSASYYSFLVDTTKQGGYNLLMKILTFLVLLLAACRDTEDCTRTEYGMCRVVCEKPVTSGLDIANEADADKFRGCTQLVNADGDTDPLKVSNLAVWPEIVELHTGLRIEGSVVVTLQLSPALREIRRRLEIIDNSELGTLNLGGFKMVPDGDGIAEIIVTNNPWLCESDAVAFVESMVGVTDSYIADNGEYAAQAGYCE